MTHHTSHAQSTQNSNNQPLDPDSSLLIREHVAKLTINAEKKRAKSKVSRNCLFGLWIDHMETSVADLMAAVQRKCKRVIALMSSDAFQR